MSDEHAPPPDGDKADGEGNEEVEVFNDDGNNGQGDGGDGDGSNGDDMDGNDEENSGNNDGSDDDFDDDDDEFQEWFADTDSMEFYDYDGEDDFFPDDDDFFDDDDDDDEIDTDQSDNQDDSDDSGPRKYFLPGGGSEFLASLWAITQEQGFADTEVTFEDGQKMQLNRIVLASLSDYFKVMLSTNMREALEGRISLPTVSLQRFRAVLAYSLGERQELAGRDHLLEVLELADMWQMNDLLHACLKQLKDNVVPDDALETYFYLQEHNYTEVKMEVKEFIQTHFRKVRLTDDFKHLSEAELLPLLDVSVSGYLCNDVLEAALAWLEASQADPSTVVRVLDAVVSPHLTESVVSRRLIANPLVWANEEARALVSSKLASKYKVCLLCFGHEVRNDRLQSTICAWSELQREWSSLEPQHKVRYFPAHSSLATDDHRVYITGGELDNKVLSSMMVFRPSSVNLAFGGSFTFEGYEMKTARMHHGSAVVKNMLWVAGGLPGPLTSVEMCYCDTMASWQSVGNLSIGVCFCSAGVVDNTLIVAGYTTADREQHVIQTFNTETHAAQVITLAVGRNHYLLPWGGLGRLHCLSLDGSLMELGCSDGAALEVKSQTQLEGWKAQAPFVAFFDGSKLVVMNSASSPVRLERYSLDGKKEAESPFYQVPALTDVVGMVWSLIKLK